MDILQGLQDLHSLRYRVELSEAALYQAMVLWPALLQGALFWIVLLRATTIPESGATSYVRRSAEFSGVQKQQDSWNQNSH